MGCIPYTNIFLYSRKVASHINLSPIDRYAFHDITQLSPRRYIMVESIKNWYRIVWQWRWFKDNRCCVYPSWIIAGDAPIRYQAWGSLSRLPLPVIHSPISNYTNGDHMLNITLVFNTCCRSYAAATPVEYKVHSNSITFILPNWKMSTAGNLTNPHPNWSIARNSCQVRYVAHGVIIAVADWAFTSIIIT